MSGGKRRLRDQGDELNDLKRMFILPLRVLDKIGLKPFEHRKIAYVMSIFIQFVRITLWYLISILVYNKRTLLTFTEATGSWVQFSHGISVYVYIFFGDKLSDMYEDMDKYYITDAVKEQSKRFQRNAQILEVICYFLGFFFTLVLPLFSGRLTFIIYVPEFPGGYFMVYLLEWMCLQFDIFFFYTTSTIFIGMMMVLRQQFEILTDQLRDLNEQQLQNPQELDSKMKTYINFHSLLLVNVERLTDIFSWTLLIQYFVSAFSLMSIMLNLANNNDFQDRLLRVCYFGVIIVQLSLYCFPAEALIEVSANIAKVIYHSLWYQNFYYAKNYVIQIMVRSQYPIVISAGGIANINREAYVNILKMAFSLFTFIHQFKPEGFIPQ